MKRLLFVVIYLTLTIQGFSQPGPTITITATEVNSGDTSNDSALSLTFTSSEAIPSISHNDNSVYVNPGTGTLNLRDDTWSLDTDIDHTLHQRNGTIAINGVTYTVTGLVSVSSSFIKYSVTPNPRDNGITTNDNRDVTTNYSQFAEPDITVSGGSISNFASSSSSVYTATFTPSGANGAKTIDVAANTFTDSAGNYNSAATQFIWIYDSGDPSITITATEVSDGDTSNDSALSLTFTSSQSTTDFAEEDITVSGGNISNFTSTSSSIYTATFTPSGGDGAKTIDVAANTFTDIIGNYNSAATQFNWIYDGSSPSITITATEVNSGDTSNDSALSLTFTSSEAIPSISHNDNSVYVNPGTGTLNLRDDTWSLDTDIDHTLHQRNGTIAINGVTYTVTGLVSVSSSFIKYSVTPNPRDNGITTNDNRDVTTNYSQFAEPDITVSGGSISNFASSSSSVYTATFTPSGANGAKTIDVAANTFTDSAGNYNSAATQFIWIYDTSLTFNNSTGDNQWSTAANWSSGSVPTLSVNVTISSGQTIEVINSTTASANAITIDSGGSLTIAKNSDLTLSGNFTNNGTVTLNSDADEFASIIVGGTASGNIIYNRYTNTVGTGEWDLIGSPVEGLSISSFVSTNSTPLATSGSIYAVGTYDNSDDTWTNYTSSSVGAAGNFDIGKGHQMATSSGATMAFTGTIATSDQTQSIINNDGNGNGGRRWNLVANPFPSYLNANNNADGTNNFLKVNLDSGVIDASFSAIYGWDADGSGYTIYNHASAATYIAPGQAFFVAAASSSAANLSFTEAMQTTTGGDDFITSSVTELNSEFYLKLYEGENFIANTRFYFDSNLTLGLDPGYDAGAYDQSMALLSRLVENDQGVGMGINAMSTESFEQTTIPLVVNRTAGTAFRISLEGITIPEDVQLFLEDTQAQTYTNLRTEDFILTPENELSGMGRFYLRIGNSSLGVEDTEESYVRVYKPNTSDYITIEGLVNVQKTKIRLYNLIGQEILNKTLSSNQTNYRISTQGIPHGVYVIKLQFERSEITKKLIIN